MPRMRKRKEKKRKITEDTIYSLLMACILVYSIMLIVYIIYAILTVFKAI